MTQASLWCHPEREPGYWKSTGRTVLGWSSASFGEPYILNDASWARCSFGNLRSLRWASTAWHADGAYTSRSKP
jgi:hypothetical protein